MKIGCIGLGKMGLNMVERLLEKGYEVLVFDKNNQAMRNISGKGSHPAMSIASLVSAFAPPRLIWIMVPYQAVDAVLKELVPFLQRGDTVIDGGNSPYKESMRRFDALHGSGINFLDAGISGGPSGARNGACIMVGGQKNVFRRHKNLFRDLACKGGYAYVGPPGSGHFAKMVHNGIEYGMMQALAEGFSILKASSFAFDVTKIASLYNHRSVIESRLAGWLRKAFTEHGESLNNISGTVSHSGEGSWTVEAARELGISVPVIEQSLRFRTQSRLNPSYTGQIISALRNQFGGHDVFRKSSDNL